MIEIVDSGIIVAVLIALGKLFKEMNFFPTKFIPLANITLGIVAGIFYLQPGNLQLAILEGIIVGLTSVGLYSSVKNVAQGVEKINKNNLK